MKNKMIAVLLVMTVTSALCGCGAENDAAVPAADTSSASTASEAAVSESVSTPVEEERKNISSDDIGPEVPETVQDENFVLEDYEYYNSAYDKFGFVYGKNEFDRYKTEEASEQGTVETLEYETPAYAVNKVTGEDYTITKKLNVYLPYGYDESKQYNVMYLMHGGGDNQDYWLMEGEGNVHGDESRKVLDNLIQEGVCDPVIVVTPTFYSDVEGVEVTNEQCQDAIAELGEDNFTSIVDLYTYYFGDEFRNQIVPLVESTYSTYAGGDVSEAGLIASRDHRAYSGLSMGSLTSLHGIYMKNTDIVSYIGSFSGAKTNVELFTKTLQEKYTDYPINFWYNGNGVWDIAFEEHYQFYQDVIAAMPETFRDGDNSAMVVMYDGSHSWTSWLADLYNVLHVFFQK